MALKLLTIDDDPEILKMIRSIVEPLGCEILGLQDSREALRRLENEKFDGVFVDARMPEPDGFEVARRVRESPVNGKVPLVMIVDKDDLETMRRGFQAGATGFLVKPVSWERLYTLVKALRGPMLLEKRRQARLPLRTPVKCKTGPGASEYTLTASEIISAGGMLLGSPSGLQAGQEVMLEFSLPTSPNPLNVWAKVLRREPPNCMAVEFTYLSEADREAIQTYIAGRITL